MGLPEGANMKASKWVFWTVLGASFLVLLESQVNPRMNLYAYR
jgi:hypothetical protein